MINLISKFKIQKKSHLGIKLINLNINIYRQLTLQFQHASFVPKANHLLIKIKTMQKLKKKIAIQ